MLRSTIVFLVLLRLAIGWHFFFEGVKKVESSYAGKSEVSKPFSSEGYFRAGEGPLAPLMIAQIGDPDEQAIALMTLKAENNLNVPGNATPVARFPVTLEKEWDAYFARFLETFNLGEDDKKLAQGKFEQAKTKVVDWLKSGEKQLKVKYPSGDVEVTKSTPQRIADYQMKLLAAKELSSRLNRVMGRDVAKKDLQVAKAEASTMREELLADLTKLTNDMKKSLGSVFRQQLLDPMPKWDTKSNTDEEILASLELQPADDKAGEDAVPKRMPKLIADRWDAYAQQFISVYKLNDAQKGDVQGLIQDAKIRYVRWLDDRDVYGTPELAPDVSKKSARYRGLLDAVKRGAAPPEPGGVAVDVAGQQAQIEKLRKEFQYEIGLYTKQFAESLDSVLNPTQTQVTATIEPRWTALQYIDWSTRWGLLLIGGALLIGLFTRFACVAGAVFLLMTYLTVSPFPWMPTPPNNEGYYLFVNKNVVEMLALCVLATVPSGRWVGLDGILVRMLRRPKAVPAQPQQMTVYRK